MRFYRPSLPKLNLDFTELGGGGSRPSQFYGVTQEHRKVYVRYRYGHLSITYEEPHEELLSAQIGDQYDGDILLEQVCDLAGLTIQGKKPFLSPEALKKAIEEGPVKDWSGKMTYWSFAFQYTFEAGRVFLTELARTVPGTFVRRSFDDNGRLGDKAVISDLPDTVNGGIYYIGTGPGDSAVLFHLEHGMTNRSDIPRRINLRMPTDTRSLNFRDDAGEFASKSRGRTVHVHPTFTGFIAGEIRSDDPIELKILESIEALVSRHFTNRCLSLDLDTGKVTNRFQSDRWYSRDLINWCDPTRMRFLEAMMQDATGKREMWILPEV